MAGRDDAVACRSQGLSRSRARASALLRDPRAILFEPATIKELRVEPVRPSLFADPAEVVNAHCEERCLGERGPDASILAAQDSSSQLLTHHHHPPTIT